MRKSTGDCVTKWNCMLNKRFVLKLLKRKAPPLAAGKFDCCSFSLLGYGRG